MEAIYSYQDYRDFLQDSYNKFTINKGFFSYRYFSKQAGFASPNFLKLVIQGKRNLSTESIPKFARVFKLKGREHRFFETLVHFNQSQQPEEKKYYYEQMLEFPEYTRAQTLAREQYEYLSQWFYSVIREMILLPSFREDPVWISRRLQGRVSPSQVRRSLEVLLRLGLLERDTAGCLKSSVPAITTGETVRHTAAFDYHQQMLEHAVLALRNQPPERREYGALTFAIGQKQIERLKEAIRNFRKVVMNIASEGSDENPTDIYQLNIQLFAHTNGEGDRL